MNLVSQHRVNAQLLTNFEKIKQCLCRLLNHLPTLTQNSIQISINHMIFHQKFLRNFDKFHHAFLSFIHEVGELFILCFILFSPHHRQSFEIIMNSMCGTKQRSISKEEGENSFNFPRYWKSFHPSSKEHCSMRKEKCNLFSLLLRCLQMLLDETCEICVLFSSHIDFSLSRVKVSFCCCEHFSGFFRSSMLFIPNF